MFDQRYAMFYKFLIGVLFFTLGQFISWFQSNSLLLGGWIKDNFILATMILAPIISAFFALGSKYLYEYFEDLYAVRFIAFSCGYLIFIPLAYIFFDEVAWTPKNILTIILCFAIIAIQFIFK